MIQFDGKIMLGKGGKKLNNGLSFIDDKSDDRTNEIMTMVLKHLDNMVEIGNTGIELEYEGLGTLTWKKSEVKTENNGLL